MGVISFKSYIYKENEKRYEKIPVNHVGNDIEYKLNPLRKEKTGSGGRLIAFGTVNLIGDILYDWLHDWKMIVNKRDAVRYKYGQQLRLSLEPKRNSLAQKAGLSLSFYF